MCNEERIEGRSGKRGGELRYIRIWQGKKGWNGIESDGKMGRRGNWGSIELNWDCLSNFEEKPFPPLLRSSAMLVLAAPRKCDLF